MKKPLLITLISIGAALLLAGTAALGAFLFGAKGQSRNEVDVTPADNTELDGGSKSIDACSPTESLFILAGNLKKLRGYSATVSGSVVVANGLYTQTVSGEKYLSGERSLYISRSDSALKKIAKQLYIEGDTALVRDSKSDTEFSDEVTRYALSDYLEEYGTDFRELSNYSLNENTVISAEFISAENGLYTFRYGVDVATAVNGYRVNMYKMGDLSELPTMTKCTLTVVMTADFAPVSVTHEDEYTVNYFFTMPCVSTITQTFSSLNAEDTIIPDQDFFTAKIAAE